MRGFCLGLFGVLVYASHGNIWKYLEKTIYREGENASKMESTTEHISHHGNS